MQGTRVARHVTISTVLTPSPQRRGQNSKAGEKQKKESPAHWSRLPRIPPFSLSPSRDSFESRVGKRGKCRAITNDRLKNSLRYSKVTTRRSEHKKSAQPLNVVRRQKRISAYAGRESRRDSGDVTRRRTDNITLQTFVNRSRSDVQGD
jgi:hypothetical protein